MSATVRKPQYPITPEAEGRFWRLVRTGAPDECWEWQGYRGPTGYGRFKLGPRRGLINAHRFAYQIEHGHFSPELDVCHTCDNRGCCNPAHLFLGTHADNMADMAAKGRSAGFGHPKNPPPTTKLDDDHVRKLRERFAAGERPTMLARDFGISQNHVWAIATGEARQSAPGPITRRPGRLLSTLQRRVLDQLEAAGSHGLVVRDVAHGETARTSLQTLVRRGLARREGSGRFRYFITEAGSRACQDRSQ